MSNVAQGLTYTLAQAESGGGGISILSLLLAGGVVGYIIILLSFVAVALAVMHGLQLREASLAPEDIAEEIDQAVKQGEIDRAIALCHDEDRDCFLTRVLGAGLQRYQRSAFGALELKSAIEEAGQAQTARLYRSTDAIGLIAAIAPMLGLLGTVVGMVGAFDTISASEGFARPDQLAGDISQALVTTLMGLTLAIPATAAFTYFRNRIDSLTGDVAERIEQIVAHLEEDTMGRLAPTGAKPAGAKA